METPEETESHADQRSEDVRERTTGAHGPGAEEERALPRAVIRHADWTVQPDAWMR
ncbi:hypothetical protein ACGFLS_06115 [Streptomyces abikoensis]|uniref:hypothetical protein n=1 Tax=Streptomyces abikoensis TaxID=97398 RepID=UPI003717FAAE